MAPKKPTPFTLAGSPLPKWNAAKQQLERYLLETALVQVGGNMAAAGRELGITKVAVLHAVRRHNLRHLTEGAKA